MWAFNTLRPLWRATAVPKELKVQVFVAVVQARVLYSLGCVVLPQHPAARLESRQVSMLRRALKIPILGGGTKMGNEPISNKRVLEEAG
eukprot:7104665-Alexandrium_andersonii.AAC.1